jgi:pyruvate/2-oxoglutarate dehydrogenase complex dihydrolipoamide acyltransferase (E2) component
MATPVRIPPLGQTSDELRLVAWLKTEGETVREGEPLLELETDKATLEIEASASGTLLRTMLEPGVAVLAGTTVGWIGEAGEAIPEADVRPRQPAPPAAPPPPVQAAPTPPPPGGRVLATPAARMLARELGIDLSSVTGSGPDGRIERRDLER